MTRFELVLASVIAEDSGDEDAKRAARGLADPAVRAVVDRVLAARADAERKQHKENN